MKYVPILLIWLIPFLVVSNQSEGGKREKLGTWPFKWTRNSKKDDASQYSKPEDAVKDLSNAIPHQTVESDLIVVTTLDGGVHALSASSGDLMWSTTTGSATVQSYQSVANAGDFSIVIPGADGKVYMESDGLLKALPLTVPELVHQSPLFTTLPSGKNIALVGSYETTVFRLDAKTGKVLNYFSSTTTDDAGEAREDEESKEEVKKPTPSESVIVSRHDYRVRAFDEATGAEVFNFSYASLKHQNKNNELGDDDNIPLREVGAADDDLMKRVNNVFAKLRQSPVVLSISGAGVQIDLLKSPSSLDEVTSKVDVNKFYADDRSIQLYASPISKEKPPKDAAATQVVAVKKESETKECVIFDVNNVCLLKLGEYTVEASGNKAWKNISTSNNSNNVFGTNNKTNAAAWRAGVILGAMVTFFAMLWLLFVKRPRVATTTNASNKEIQLVGKLQVNMGKIKGFGCNGTIVVEGSFEGRPVAVKRMQSALYDKANKEVDLLIQSEGHLNVVRYLAKEETIDFVYLALELCETTLDEALRNHSSPIELNDNLRVFLGEISSALHHLHSNNIVHCDLKPQNVLVVHRSKTDKHDATADFGARWIPKLSDMGLSRNVEENSHFQVSSFQATSNGNNLASSASRKHHLGGTVGWRAPELTSLLKLKDGKSNLSRKVDVFSLGCLFFYILENGKHVFGDDWYNREQNVMSGNAVNLSSLTNGEAIHLVSRMIASTPEKRPPIASVVTHPLLWSASKRLEFFCDVSDKVETAEETAVGELEKYGARVFGKLGWVQQLHPTLRDDVLNSKHRRYEANSLKDLLRYMRNKRHHRESENLQNALPWEPEAFLRRFHFDTLCISVVLWVLAHLQNDDKFSNMLQHQFLDNEPPVELSQEKPAPQIHSAIQEALDWKSEPKENILTDFLTVKQKRRGWFVDEEKFAFANRKKHAELFSSLQAAQKSVRDNFQFKKNLCVHWVRNNGYCLAGDKCGFAHGPVELRENFTAKEANFYAGLGDVVDRPVENSAFQSYQNAKLKKNFDGSRNASSPSGNGFGGDGGNRNKAPPSAVKVKVIQPPPGFG